MAALVRLRARSSQQDQRHDDRGRFEVDADLPVVRPEGLGEYAGKSGGDNAVDPGDGDAECDQREHVEAAIDDRLPASDKERPPAPEHHWCGQHELDPVHGRSRERVGQIGPLDQARGRQEIAHR
jgi:hypothetical protein